MIPALRLGMAEDVFVDLRYRGLDLGEGLLIGEFVPGQAYLQTPQPMPVGSELSIHSGEVEVALRVAHVSEQITGRDRVSGMLVTPIDLQGMALEWWDARVSEMPAPVLPETESEAASASVEANETGSEAASTSVEANETGSEAASTSVEAGSASAEANETGSEARSASADANETGSAVASASADTNETESEAPSANTAGSSESQLESAEANETESDTTSAEANESGSGESESAESATHGSESTSISEDFEPTEVSTTIPEGIVVERQQGASGASDTVVMAAIAPDEMEASQVETKPVEEEKVAKKKKRRTRRKKR